VIYRALPGGSDRIVLYYCLIATWTGLGDNMELFWAVLSQVTRGCPQPRLKSRHDTRPNWSKKVTQHLVVVTQNESRTFWSWDQNQNDNVIIPFPTHPYTPRFDAGWGKYCRNRAGMSAESEPNVAAELEMTSSLGKDVSCAHPASRCSHQDAALPLVTVDKF
jgi:hypothetical protein